MDYWTNSLDKTVIIGVKESKEKLLVKSEDEYTSPIAKIFKVGKEYIIADDDTPLNVEIDEQKRIYVNKNEILLSSLTPQLIQIKSANHKVKVHLRGDTRLNYGAIAVVAGEIRNAGIQVIALRTDMATLKNEIEAFPLNLIKPKSSKNGG